MNIPSSPFETCPHQNDTLLEKNILYIMQNKGTRPTNSILP